MGSIVSYLRQVAISLGSSKHTDSSVHALSTTAAFATQAGRSQGQTKTNQDVALLLPDIEDQPRTHLYGILDGHGPRGDVVAHWLAQEWSPVFQRLWSELLDPVPAMIQTFSVLNASLLRTRLALENGSTACFVLQQGSRLWTFHAGDSRLVLFRPRYGSDSEPWDMIPVFETEDHAPDSPKERQRILAAGGCVTQDHRGEARMHRVDSNWPALSVSRSLGDQLLVQPGLMSAVPDVSEHSLEGPDRPWFAVLGSDGLFGELSLAEVGAVVWPYQRDVQEGARALVRRARAQAEKASACEPDLYVDDITALVLWFEPK